MELHPTDIQIWCKYMSAKHKLCQWDSYWDDMKRIESALAVQTREHDPNNLPCIEK